MLRPVDNEKLIADRKKYWSKRVKGNDVNPNKRDVSSVVRLSPIQPFSDRPIDIIEMVTSNLDKGIRMSIETLRVNLVVCFKDICQKDLCLYEEKINDIGLMMKVYQEVFLMMKECNIYELDEHSFNVITNKYRLDKFKPNILLDDEFGSTSLELMYDTTNQTMDVLITTITAAIFITVTGFLVLEFIIPMIFAGYDTTWTPYIIGLMCIVVCVTLATGHLSAELDKLREYKNYLKELRK